MIRTYTNYPLKHLHTFRMEAFAKWYAEYETVEDLRILLARLKDEWAGMSWFHMGGGSNLLFISPRYEGVIFHSSIKGWDIVDDDVEAVQLKVGAGVVWDELVAHTVSQGWCGMENLSLIPGEVGASAVQNIGAYGVEVKDLIVSVHTLDVETGEERIFGNKECEYAYRHSVFKDKLKGRYIVTHVTYRLWKVPKFHLDYGNIRSQLESMGDAITLERVRGAVIAIRESKLPDPSVMGNAGSFFMNPVVPRSVLENIRLSYPAVPYYEVDNDRVKIPAGWMIEQCGWKGRSLGQAAVHDRQALVLVNLGNASGHDVMALSDAVRHSVREKFGVDIWPEVNFV